MLPDTNCTERCRPTLSVIMPCHKSEKWIEAMLRDLIAQTYTDWELIAVSNGAGQEPQLEILTRVAAELPEGKAEIISLEWGNVSNARNVGIDRARGKWLTIIDADDRLDPNHLELLMSKAGGDVDLVVAGITYCDDQNNVVALREVEDETEWLTAKGMATHHEVLFATWNKLYNLSFLRQSGVRFDPALIRGADVCFHDIFLWKTTRIKWVKMSGYHYCVHSGNYRIPRYYPNGLKVGRASLNLIYGMRRQAGIYSESDDKNYARGFCNVYKEAVRNLFRVGSPFTFLSTRTEISRLIFHNSELAAYMAQLPPAASLSSTLKLFTLCYRAKSATLMALVFLLMEKSNLIARICFGGDSSPRG